LLRKIQQQTGMAMLLITHDLGVVAENADVVAVMYASRIVEVATVEDLFDRPQHPYTVGLFQSVPKLGHESERLQTIPGTVPNPAKFPTGCKFHTRCPRTRALATQTGTNDVVSIKTGDESAKVMRVCTTDEPNLRETLGAHWAACHFAENYPAAQPTTPTLDHRREIVPDVIDAAESVPTDVEIMQETRE